MRNRNDAAIAALCVAVALMASIAAGLGVFARGDGTFVTVTSVRGVTYEMATTGVYAYNAQRVVAEGVGWDVFTLSVAVPATLLAAWLVARGSDRGRLFALGLMGYFLYQYLEYAMTWAFGPLFPLFIAVVAAALAAITWLVTSVARDGADARFGDGFPGRPFAAVNITLSVLLVLLWAQRIAVGLGGDLEGAGLRGETTMVVQALDLGLVVPASLLISILAWRGTAIGRVAASAFVVTAVAMSAAIVAMLISAAVVEGNVEVPPIVIFGTFMGLNAALGVRMYQAGWQRSSFSLRAVLQLSARRAGPQ